MENPIRPSRGSSFKLILMNDAAERHGGGSHKCEGQDIANSADHRAGEGAAMTDEREYVDRQRFVLHSWKDSKGRLT
ncbi:hypothetical protein, partial [Bartonella sp. CL29QHWL]|uniref:hypothetical protein n=1 Tax=Bartonella sp. CL29QHWL TaxID=3243522 RepID=UPI0035D0A3B4